MTRSLASSVEQVTAHAPLNASASPVLCVSNSLKVVRVETELVATEMVNLKPLGNISVNDRVDDAMNVLKTSTREVNGAVSSACGSTRPDPAVTHKIHSTFPSEKPTRVL
jgi:hypothetical protein